jgi:hypothetical protein
VLGALLTRAGSAVGPLQFRGLATAILLSAIAALGCTVVRVEASGDDVRIERYFGIVSIELNPSKGPATAEMRSVGLAGSPFGLQLGWASQSFTALPPSCYVALWIDERGIDRDLEETLRKIDQVCVVSNP